MTDPVDELFVGSLDEFVKRRDALVRDLKKNGDKQAAAEVKTLRKPSNAAWAVNQVARRRVQEIDALIAAARDVHDAQARAVQGNDRGDLRPTTEAWRTQIRALAAEVAKDAGEQYRDDAAATFEAASTSEEWSAVLRAGRLVTTLAPTGFGLQDMPDPVLTRRHEPEPEPEMEPEPEPAQPARDQAAIAAAEKRLERATHQLRRAEQRLDQAREAVDGARAARDAAAEALRNVGG